MPDGSDLPPQNTWTSAERGTWLLMNATVSVLVQTTHIQFLTLLFPSRLEARLIYFLLGPLAVVAAAMQFIPIQETNSSLNNIANNIRNVCNATLSLLFTASLFIWGLLVNRSKAWRTDGGTAVFGAGALGLALVSTALNFLYVPKNQQYVWLPGLIWAVILWQSFLGWWWWVGAGSGESAQTTDEVVEILLQRGEKLVRKRRQTKENKRKKRRQGTDADAESSSHEHEHGPSSENTTASPSLRPRPRRTDSHASTTSSISILPSFFPRTIRAWYHNLRQEHVTAARRQTVERAERIREIEMTGNSNRLSGWGLGSFGWRVSRDEYDMECIPRHRRRSNDSHCGSGSEDEQGPPEVPSPKTVSRKKSGNLRNSNEIPRLESSVSIQAGTRSMWSWGPLNRWRLQDSTAYH